MSTKAAQPKKTPRKRAAKPKKPVTNDLLCTMVLDMSGSMSSVHLPVIEGVNQYIEDLKNDDSGETLFSLTAFDTVFEHWHIAEPVESIGSIAGRYQPRGGTVLYDAIAHSILETDRKLKKMKRDDIKILHVTVTDGGENSSEDYAGDNGRIRLAELVKSKEASGNWTFVYLGAGHASVHAAQMVAGAMGYSPGNSMKYASTPGGVANTTSSLSMMTSTVRSSEAGATLDAVADSGLAAADFDDPSASSTPNPIVPKTGDVANATNVITSKSLSDALGGK